MNHKAKNQKTIIVRCPTCRQSVKYDLESPFRPFCSERCRIQDTAAWADECYRIAGPPAESDEGTPDNPEDDFLE